MKLANDKGSIFIIVPGGIIRSQGTQKVRKELFSNFSETDITVFDNKCKFFAIDSRFKFCTIAFKEKVSESSLSEIKISKYKDENNIQFMEKYVKILLNDIKAIRKDLSIPEIYTDNEWRLFKKLNINGEDWSKKNSLWYPEFCREVDMTNHKKYFDISSNDKSLPVIEGRMIQNYRTGAKTYCSGDGRSAIWKINNYGNACIRPHYYIGKTYLNIEVKKRVESYRAGFCDIVGQTNERAMMASLIQPDIVCGNKVPTVIFPNDNTIERIMLWLGVVNSFVFDWLLRRVVTTTANYFLLTSLPMPIIDIRSNLAKDIINKVKQVLEFDKVSGGNLHQYGELRAEIDAMVAIAYDISSSDLETIFNDFPLIDKGQPCINGEKKSTITKDFILKKYFSLVNRDTNYIENRIKASLSVGAIPYISGELNKNMKDG